MEPSETPSNRLEIDLVNPNPLQIDRAAEVVRRGGIVLYPTDTVYGLGCSALQTPAISRLFELKQRPSDRGVLLLIPELTWVERCTHSVPETFLPLAKALWPGPVTFLLPASPRVSGLISGAQGKVGLRQPKLPFLRSWLYKIGAPLVSTSANISGRPVPQSVEELAELFESEVDLFLDGGATSEAEASTVVDLCSQPIQIVREGRLAEKIRWLLLGMSKTDRGSGELD